MSDSKKTTPIRVLCVDDHAFIGTGLRARLDVESDLEFVGHLESAHDLVDHVRRTKADIVLLDIEMPDSDVFETLYELRHRCPDARAILLSAHVRDKYIDSAFSSGAWGYLTKSDPPDDVIEGIRKVARGESVLSPLLESRQVTANQPEVSKLALLTERERQILRMIANGMSRKAIAERLSRSPMTIDNHRKSILKKLGIHDRVELVRYAIANELGEL